VNVQAVSALLAALLILAIGVAVVLRSRRNRVYSAFAAFSLIVSIWHLFTFLGVTTASPLMQWLSLWAAATIPPLAIRFFRIFLAQPSIGGQQRGPRVTLAWTVLAYAALVYSAIVREITNELWFTIPFGLYVFGSLYRCVWDMYRQYRSTVKQVEKTRVRYLALGGFVATTLTLSDGLPRLGVAWPTIGNILGILYLYFLSQSLFRNRLIDLNELVGKMAVLGTLVILLWAVYGFLLYWIGGGQKGLYLLNALVASFVILILFEPVRSRLENGINRWLLRQRHELRGRLEVVRRDLPGVVDVSDMVSRIITALEESRRVTDASLYLLDADGAAFELAGHFGARPADRIDIGSDRVFLDRVRTGGFDTQQLLREREELRGEPDNESKSAALSACLTKADELSAALIFPLFGSAETEQGPWLLGLLCIRDDRALGAFDLDDADLFRGVATAAARVIESSQAYERVKERDRLAALGEMAAGLAHEIRNPLGAIKGAAQLLIPSEGRQTDPGEMSELLGIIVEEANRLNNVVTRFLDYARAERPGREGSARVDLNAIVRKTAHMLGQQDDVKNVEVRLRTDDLLPNVAGDAESILQVFLNLGLNALQAMPTGGTLEILTTRRRRSRLGYGQFAEVRFRDTGVGIPRDKLKKLFIPFYTTKTKGTGLGLAISQRIINQHGGTIEVRSTLGQGSTFSVFLPAADAVRQEDVKDITETGRLSAPMMAVRPDPTPPVAPVVVVIADARGTVQTDAADSSTSATASDDEAQGSAALPLAASTSPPARSDGKPAADLPTSSTSTVVR
jgi:two-component system, NtrC family, sensor histidine kinase HydH